MNTLTRNAVAAASIQQFRFDFPLPETKRKSAQKAPCARYPGLIGLSSLDETIAGRIANVTSHSAITFHEQRPDHANYLVGTFESHFQAFWLKRYRHYSNTQRFCERVADLFGLPIATVLQVVEYLGLPKCQKVAEKELLEHRFATCLYIDSSDSLRDPLDLAYKKTCYRASMAESFGDYLALYGWLSPDMLCESDLRYVLRHYAFPLPIIAQILQIQSDELARYVESMKIERPAVLGSRPPVFRDLLGRQRHERLSRIVLSCAQSLYTNQAVPLRELAIRIGVSPMVLYAQAEQLVGDWAQPKLQTIQHVIEHTTALHLQNGGLLRVNE